MTLRKSRLSILPLLPLLVTMASGAFLQGCGSLSDEAMAHAGGMAVPEKTVAEAGPLTNDYKLPDVPKDLAACVVKDPAPGADANHYVANMKLTLAERKACSKRLLEWYKLVQKSQQKKAADAGKPPKSLIP